MFLILPVCCAAQKRKAVFLGAGLVANDIINSSMFCYHLNFEEQFDDRWSFSFSVKYGLDSVSGVSSLNINGVEKSVLTKYQSSNRSVEMGFRYYFDEAFNGLYIGPLIGIHNFDIVSPYANNSELYAQKKKATSFVLGLGTGMNFKFTKRLLFQIAGSIGHGFVRASGYRNNLIATGSAGIGYMIDNRKPKNYWE